MKSKQLEVLLAQQLEIGGAEMLQRFQKLRDNGLLSKGRGRNAEFLSSIDIVDALLSIVAEKPGFAGQRIIVLGRLMPVGGPEAGFAGAATFRQAVAAALDDEKALESLRQIRVSDHDFATNAMGRAAISYSDGDQIKTAWYVPSTAVSHFQPGYEVTFDPLEGAPKVFREVVYAPTLLKMIVRRKKEPERVEALHSEYET